MTDIITIKLGSCADVQGERVWGPNSDNVACVRMEDGTTMQGDYIPSIPGLFDAKKARKA